MTLLLVAVGAVAVIWLVTRANRARAAHHYGGGDAGQHRGHRGC